MVYLRNKNQQQRHSCSHYQAQSQNSVGGFIIHGFVKRQHDNETNYGQHENVVNRHSDVLGVVQGRNVNFTCLPGKKKAKEQLQSFVSKQYHQEVRLVSTATLIQRGNDKHILIGSFSNLFGGKKKC